MQAQYKLYLNCQMVYITIPRNGIQAHLINFIMWQSKWGAYGVHQKLKCMHEGHYRWLVLYLLCHSLLLRHRLRLQGYRLLHLRQQEHYFEPRRRTHLHLGCDSQVVRCQLDRWDRLSSTSRSFHIWRVATLNQCVRNIRNIGWFSLWRRSTSFSSKSSAWNCNQNGDNFNTKISIS